MHSRTAARQAYLLVIGLLLAPALAGAQAIDHSDAYYKRLNIHRIGSYTELPLFAAQYYLGNQLLNHRPPADWVKPTHKAVAYSIAGLFTVNTVTGVWNLIEARNDPNKFKRYLHAALMLSADAGFTYTGLVTAKDASNLGDDARHHRKSALISVGAATAGTLVMWLWPDEEE